MSGGVDSSVAAALLSGAGHEVVGLTMCFNLPEADGRTVRCCGWQGIEDARRVAQTLGIRHYVLNMQRLFAEKVIDNFCLEYLAGRTPNPCVRCNQFLKFEALLKKALSFGAVALATGHYARIYKKGTSYSLQKAKDKSKDQSYFLYRLTQTQLAHTRFPLGGLLKTGVRSLARKLGLAVADKPDSQEICFLPDEQYRNFVARYRRKPAVEGPVVDTQGRLLGRHRGIAFYTIGQRQGIGIACGRPVYVTRIDPEKNQITVGSRQEASAREFLVSDTHFIAGAPEKKIAARVRIRYNHEEMPAEIIPEPSQVRVVYAKPQFAITPGQSAVFYRGGIVLGGGIIQRVIE